MNSVIQFLTSATGRFLRIVLGLFLIWVGLYDGVGEWLVVVGLLPLAAGVFNFCILAPLFGYPFFPRKSTNRPAHS
jgi:hypothetical protein